MSREQANTMNSESKDIDVKIHNRAVGFVTKVMYNHTGDMAYIGDKDSKKILVVETSNNKIVGSFEGHNGVVWDIDLTDDDNIMMSCSGDLSVIIWEAKTGEGITKIKLAHGIPEKISIQKKEETKYAVVCYKPRRGNSKLVFFDLMNINENMEPIKTIDWTYDSAITSIKWLDGNKYLVGCKDGKLVVKDFANDEFNEIHDIHTDGIQSIEINRLGTVILTSSLDKSAKEISVDRFTVLKTYNSPVPVNCAIYTKKDREVVIAGGVPTIKVANTTNNDFGMKFFRTKDQKLMRQIIYHSGAVRSMSASPVSNNIISGSQDGSAVIYVLTADSEEDVEESEGSNINFKEINNLTLDEGNDIYKIVGTFLKEGKTQVHYVNNPKVVSRNNNVNKSNDPNNNLNDDEFTIDNNFITERIKQREDELEKQVKENDELFVVNIVDSSTNTNTYTSSTSSEPYQYKARELTTIRVSNFPSLSVEDARNWLYSEFGDHGKIQRVNLDAKNITKNGVVGYVTYMYKECAERAVELKNGAREGYQVLCVELIENRY